MAYTKINDKFVVDWTTGDEQGDRMTLLSAYRDFISELVELNNNSINSGDVASGLSDILEKWSIDIDNQIDEVPRIWIKRPE